MTFRKYSLLISIFVYSQVFACVPATENDYAAMDVAIVSGNNKLRDYIYENYCLDYESFYKQMVIENKDYQGILKARDVQSLKIVFQENKPIDIFANGSFNRDILSFYMLPFHQPHIDKANLENANKYLSQNNHPQLTPLDMKTHNSIVSYILDRYISNNYVFKDSQYGYNNLMFTVLTNNFLVFEKLVANNSELLYEKNKFGFYPLHYLFSKKMNYSKNDSKKNQKRINELALSIIDESLLAKMQYDGVGFLEFAQALKEENLEFYLSLKKKFNYKDIEINTSKKTYIKNKLNESLTPILNSYLDVD